MSTPSPAPIRTAVLGFGLAGKVFHCPFIAAVPGLELAAIVQRSGDTAAVAYPTARILRSPQEAFADPNIDLIVVGTPNETHFDLTSQALQAGKHVVVDKPLTTSATAARALIDLAKQYGRILAPFHNRRYDTDFLTVSKLHREGTLGRITQVVAHFDRFRPLQRPGTWKEIGGDPNGLLFDLGPHLVDQAVALFGLPARITGSVRTDRDKTDIDDAFDIVLEYDITSSNGDTRSLRYECHATMLAANASPRFLVHGTRGSYIKQGLDPQESTLLGGARPPQLGSPEAWLPEPESAWGTLSVGTDLKEPIQVARTPYPSVTGDYRLFYANVRNAIRGEAPLAIPSEDGYRVIQLLELARQSSHERRTLPVTFG